MAEPGSNTPTAPEAPCRARGRFAPSPSGRMHLGNAWTALLAWLSARSKGGAMVLRLEDLDPDRSKDHFASAILEDTTWLGLDWDEGPDKGGPYGPYRQDQRRDSYQRCLDELTARGLVYPCWCTRAELRRGCEPFKHDPDLPDPDSRAPRHPAMHRVEHALAAQAPHAGEHEPAYAGTCLRLPPDALAAKLAGSRAPSLRVKAGTGSITFTDLVLGPQEQDLAQAGDFVLRRSDGVHAYQLAVVADDAAQRITEVVRGADLLDSTGRQIFLYRTFGWPEPAFAHVPLLLDPDGRRLSKRRGDVDLGRLRQAGVQPEALVGFLAWKAGLQDAPRPVAAADLVDGFSFRPMPQGPIIIANDWLKEVT